MTSTAMTKGVPASVAADIEELLGDLDLDSEMLAESDSVIEDIEGEQPEVIIEDPVVEDEVEASADELSDDALTEGMDIDDLDLAIAKEEVHASQESATTIDDEPAEAPAAAAKPARKASTRTAPTRTPRSISEIEPTAFVLEGDATEMSSEDLEANKASVIAAKPTIKKVGEKYENLFAALSVGKEPSVYVVSAFKLIDSKRTVTATDVKAMFKGLGHTEGTAQSQAGQIMALFDVLKIARRDRNTLVMNDNSAIAQKLRKIINDKAAA